MTFSKAEDLLDLAAMVRAHRAGVTLADVERRFDCSRRTAQRMMRHLESRYPDVETDIADDGTKRWRLRSGLKEMLSLGAEELAALDLAIEQFAHGGQRLEARMLERLRDKVVALVPGAKAARLDTDHDALLEAQGFVARPGPRPLVDEAVAATFAEAIKACLVVEMEYQARTDPAPRRRAVEPFGLLSGARRYLVARPEGDETGPVRTYRMDAIRSASLTDRPFARPDDFDLQAFSRRAFGLFQSEKEYGEVLWRFSPEAATHARGYLFHPDQEVTQEPDGSLLVRFHAAGHLEMAWHLYAWGDKVEVLKPAALRRLVEGHRRSDFEALP
ncbi:MAG: WYL domain-containing protein [Alsobacter sp.]